MPDIVHVTYGQTGQSSNTNEFGMREMQQKAYEAREAQYLLLKAPPASGKSRALMYIALDKLTNQGIKKVIVAVPEKSSCYREKPFESDEERLEYLFKLYEKMIEEEKNKGTLFEGGKKGKRKKININ
jgi:hypothetical protein